MVMIHSLKKGFVNWRNGLETFTAHVGKVDSIHNKARKHALAFKNQNIVRAIGLIGTVLKNMNEMRENGWVEIFDEAKAFCAKRNIIVPNIEDTIPIRDRSRGRGAKLVSYYHHFHHNIFIVVTDQILVELNNRFAERSTHLLRCIACLDPKNSFSNFDQDKLLELANICFRLL
uniref:Uncharacterized protein n=1 Tax=Avena sativa TaxID=4498 RepID=A0ACD5V035_AVESA